MSKIPTYAEVEQWHLLDKIKVIEWLEEMLKKERNNNKMSDKEYQDLMRDNEEQNNGDLK